MHEEPRHGDVGALLDNAADGGHVVHVGTRQRTGLLLPHQARVRRLFAELTLGERLGVYHPCQRHEPADTRIRRRPQDPHGAAHAVADETHGTLADDIEHAAQVRHLFGDRTVLKSPFRTPVAGKRQPQGRDPGSGQRLGEGDEEGPVLVARHTMAEDDKAGTATLV